MFLLNWISVRGFGEAEYWFSLIKVATVIIFIIVGVMMIGIFKGAQPAGWSNWGSTMRRLPAAFGDDWRGDDCRLLVPGHRAYRHRGR
jgi:amino acid permease